MNVSNSSGNWLFILIQVLKTIETEYFHHQTNIYNRIRKHPSNYTKRLLIITSKDFSTVHNDSVDLSMSIIYLTICFTDTRGCTSYVHERGTIQNLQQQVCNTVLCLSILLVNFHSEPLTRNSDYLRLTKHCNSMKFSRR